MKKLIVTCAVAAVLAFAGCIGPPDAEEAPAGPPVAPPAVPAPPEAPAPPSSPAPAPPPPAAGPDEAEAVPFALKVVGHLNPGAGSHNITDLWALKARDGRSYVYLGAFDEPDCGPDITGVHIVDITEPAAPRLAGFVPSPSGAFVSDVGAVHIETSAFRGDLLVFTTEKCRRNPGQPAALGPVIYDITDPLSPKLLAQGFFPFETHNSFTYQQGDRAFVLVVQDDAEQDFHIVEITDPSSPHHVSARGWVDWFDPAVDQLRLGQTPVPLLHDVWAQVYPDSHPDRSLAGRTIAYLSYWDAGLVILDITRPDEPRFLGDSDYLAPDPLSGLPPEGNSHSAVPTADGKLVFMGDEDFSPTHPASTGRDGAAPPAGENDANGTVFDGWGYARILDVSNPSRIVEVGRFATAGAFDRSLPPGDHSIHNIFVEGRRAYLSWYADGIRVVDFSRPEKPVEVAYFVDTQAGSDFWGVYLYRHPDGKAYILGSDRSTGLWIFEAP